MLIATQTANNNSLKARTMKNKDGKRPVDITNKLPVKKLVAPVMTVGTCIPLCGCALLLALTSPGADDVEKEAKANADKFKSPTH